MKLVIAVLFLAMLAACGVTRNRTVGSYPDGSIAQEVDCRRDHPEKCMQRSQQLCQPFSRQPQILRPLVFDESQGRWTTVITCGPPVGGLTSPPPMAPPPGGAPAVNAGPPAPTTGFTPLPPRTPPSSNVPQ
jgi:hypothetical protein